jgi:hypothetical protein
LGQVTSPSLSRADSTLAYPVATSRKPPLGWNAPGPRLARPTGGLGSRAKTEASLHQLAGGCFTGRTRRPGSYDECAWLCEARQTGAQKGARHAIGSHVPDERFPSGWPMIDIATEILQSLQARNGKCIGTEEVAVIHPLPWDIRTNAAGFSVIVDATGTEVLLAFGEDLQTSRAVAEFVVRSLLSYSRP